MLSQTKVIQHMEPFVVNEAAENRMPNSSPEAVWSDGYGKVNPNGKDNAI
jgi:hypothetical protein